MDVLEKVRFDQVFSFKYSPRPHTKASTFENQIPDNIASSRLTRLQARYYEILEEIMHSHMNEEHLVYFDELKSDGMVAGRTDSGKLILVKGSEELLGEIKKVKITKTSRMTLIGSLV
jgi:tRNA-2-methylthio-N6-dimethylallyladenosine synthase